MKKKVLIFGAVGFLGSHIVDKFVDQRWEVIGIDKHKTAEVSRSTGLATYYSITLPSKRFEGLLSTVKPNMFIHAAGTA